MNILIMSDSHDEAERVKKLVEKVKADHVIHCGDFCTEVEALPNVPLTYVKGNCDFAEAPDEQMVELGGLRFYVTHGHLYQVKQTPMPLKYRGQEVQADIVCFGHSHIPFCEQTGKMLMINPGSLSRPRGFASPTYVLLRILPKREVQVQFFQTDGRPFPQRGGTFQLA